MAEAEDSPRKTTTYKRFANMNSQNDRYGVGQDEFFWLENVMVVGSAKMQSVPGPSAVLATLPL